MCQGPQEEQRALWNSEAGRTTLGAVYQGVDRWAKGEVCTEWEAPAEAHGVPGALSVQSAGLCGPPQEVVVDAL